MEAKATAFVEAFSATLFAQWAEQKDEARRFWRDDAFLREVLEEGVAKLPKAAIKTVLARDLARYVDVLRTQLQQKHAAFQAAQTSDAQTPLLLSEEDVERALATAPSDDAKAHIDAVLAIEDAAAVRVQTAVRSAQTVAELVAAAEQSVAQLRTVRARRFASAAETDRTVAFYLSQVHASVAAAAKLWVDQSNGRWVVDAADNRCRERETLRTLLQTLVAADLVRSSNGTARPWTAFFRPQESSMFRVDVAAARAGIYGALLSLAVSFPVVFDEDENDEDEDHSTSEDSSSEDDANESRQQTKKTKKTKTKPEDCASLAAHVARQVVLAARRHANDANDWLLAVLAAFHAMPRPSAFVDDEDDDALSSQQQRALHDALAELYARAFASAASLWPRRQGSPLALLETLLCLRHAAEFMRIERKQTVPAVAAATSQLVGVALPPAFWKWMLHVKKVFAGEHAVVQAAMKKLSKHKSDKKTANVLLHDSVLSLSDMRVLVEHFALFLEAEKERAHFVVARAPTAADQQPQDDDEAVGDQTLFFMDNDGGDKNKKRSSATRNDATEKETRKRGRKGAAKD